MSASTKTSADSKIAHDEPPRDKARSEVEASRGIVISSPVRSLLEVKKIYVDSRGDISLRGKVRDSLITTLQTSKRFDTAQTPEEGDAALKLFVNRERAGRKISQGQTQRNAKAPLIERGTVSVRLVNADGHIIWPGERNRSYIGSALEVAEKIVNDLLMDREKLDRKQ